MLLLALVGLGEAIDGQFTRWGLTAAERAVGLLLLKGLSLREIAQLRAASERTVRQQALDLYRRRAWPAEPSSPPSSSRTCSSRPPGRWGRDSSRAGKDGLPTVRSLHTYRSVG